VPNIVPGLVRWASSRFARCRHGFAGAAGSHFGQSEVENLGVAALGDENIRRLDVAVDNALGVRSVERIGDFDRQREPACRSPSGGSRWRA
jgi:hypothetical protein